MNRLAALPVAAALLTLSACGATPSVGPDAAPATAPSTPTARSRTFGPDGYAGVRLGMDPTQARAAGAVVEHGNGCTQLVLSGVPAGVGGGLLSPRHGVVLIDTKDPRVATPEGVHVGMSPAQVRAVYPGLRRAPDFWAVAVPGHPGTSYWLGFRRGHLGGLTLVRNDEDCVN